MSAIHVRLEMDEEKVEELNEAVREFRETSEKMERSILRTKRALLDIQDSFHVKAGVKP